MAMRLRPYQTAAADAVLARWETEPTALVVLPTGTGKTVMFADLIRRRPAGRAMILAHREELIWQAAQTIGRITSETVGIEMAERWAQLDHERITVSTIQTQISGFSGKGRMSRFRPSEFSTLVIDECHHTPAASYRRVLNWYTSNTDLRILGVTATPDRRDKRAIVKRYGPPVYYYQIDDAIRDGWLVPIVQSPIRVLDVDFSHIGKVAGDLNQGQLGQVMEAEKALHGVADATREIAGKRRTLIFAVRVVQAERLAEILNRHEHGCARWVCGKTDKDERRQMLRDYAAGRFQFLINVGVATEGFDEPGIELVAIARPTTSRPLYAQMVGRGTRPLPGLVDGAAEFDDAGTRRDAIAASGKPCLEVLDFAGNAGKHKLVCTADLLGDKYDEQTVERARRIVKQSREPIDPAAALEKAAEEIRAQRQRSHVVGRATWQRSYIDPFDILAIKPSRNCQGWRGLEATEKQSNLLARLGIPTDGLTRKQAAQLITETFQRMEAGACTYKQARLLKRYGYDTSDLGKDDATRLIDTIAANGWRRP